MHFIANPPAAAKVLGTRIWGLTLDAFLDLAFERIRDGQRTLFSTANAHSLVVAFEQEALAEHFRSADAVLPDGFLAVFGARCCGGTVVERVAGPDFFEAFLRRAAREGISVYFLGSTDATLSRIVSRASASYPGLRIAGSIAPPFGEFDAAANARLVRAVRLAKPDALFVGMTAPKQELWLSTQRDELDVPFAMGVGAAFDFFAGNRMRPPRVVGQNGGEWLFRLLSEPKRLWRRNLNSVVFLWLLLRDILRRWTGRKKNERP